MWGLFLGCVGTLAVAIGLLGIFVWLTWPQESFDFIGELDGLEDDEWKSR